MKAIALSVGLSLTALGSSACHMNASQRLSALSIVTASALSVDWAQTRSYVGICRELNPVIGACGERLSPDLYFPLVITGVLVSAWLLPRPWGEVFLAGVTGVEAETVYTNAVME